MEMFVNHYKSNAIETKPTVQDVAASKEGIGNPRVYNSLNRKNRKYSKKHRVASFPTAEKGGSFETLFLLPPVCYFFKEHRGDPKTWRWRFFRMKFLVRRPCLEFYEPSYTHAQTKSELKCRFCRWVLVAHLLTSPVAIHWKGR